MINLYKRNKHIKATRAFEGMFHERFCFNGEFGEFSNIF